MADGVIDSLSIEIGASSKNAVKNINALVDAMRALKDAASILTIVLLARFQR